MKYIKNAEEFHMNEDCAVTIGKFDGIHRGHEFLAQKMIAYAKDHHMASCVITFDKNLRFSNGMETENKAKNLITNEERAYLIQKLDADYLLELSFTEELKNLSPRDFLILLTRRFNMRHLVVGTDFTFGAKGLGNVALLNELKDAFGFSLEVINKIKECDREISSTYIRDEIQKGQIENANRLLGYHYFVYGTIVHGNHIGTKISTPTINILPTSDKLLPLNGVYVTNTEISGKRYRSVTNIGIRPTIEEQKKQIGVETHILDFNEDIYGQEAKVDFLAFIRPEKKFASLDDLALQIHKDTKRAKSYSKRIK